MDALHVISRSCTLMILTEALNPERDNTALHLGNIAAMAKAERAVDTDSAITDAILSMLVID